MRDYAAELDKRVDFIRNLLDTSGAKGIVYGNSGGKDCTLVGLLCKRACDQTVGVIMPCQSKRNYGQDTDDALAAAKQAGIETLKVDLSAVKVQMLDEINKVCPVTDQSSANIAPRLRMTVLYAVAQSRGYLVAGTGNRSERFMGYFTKWGDGACDFNPIGDLTVTEVYEFLRFLGAPERIISKAPSAGLFEGQTDEQEMGVTYAQIDGYILNGQAEPALQEKLERVHAATAHKRDMPVLYEGV